MTIKITQTCNVCKRERELTNLVNLDHERQVGGWREIYGKDICPDDIKKIFE